LSGQPLGNNNDLGPSGFATGNATVTKTIRPCLSPHRHQHVTANPSRLCSTPARFTFTRICGGGGVARCAPCAPFPLSNTHSRLQAARIARLVVAIYPRRLY
jgi:hypothetical protein